MNEDDYTLDITQMIQYKNLSNKSLNNLKFNLYPKAFAKGATNKPVSSLNEQKAYPNGKSYGDIEFFNVSSKGQTLTYTLEEIDKNILNITLPQSLNMGYSINIEMQYKLTLPNINHRFGYGNNAINLGNFYPIACVIEDGEFVIQPYSSNGDPFYSNLSNYLVNISYPSDFFLWRQRECKQIIRT